MARITSCLRFLLLWLLPYAAIIVAIWAAGVYVDGAFHQRDRLRVYFGVGPRCTLIAAATCWWLTAWGVTWAARRPHPEFPPRPARDPTPAR
jgi:hypothetical protein